MKLQDKETLSIANTVSDVLEGKTQVKEIKFPHKMYGPKGEEVTAKDQAEHEDYSAKGYSHTKPVKEVDEPTAQGEKDFKSKHKVKKSGMNNDGSVTKESTISETTVKTSILDDWDGPGNIQTHMKKMAKEFKVKATFKNGAGNGTAGPDLAMFTGKDEDLIKFVNEFFGKVSNSKELKAWSENVKNEKRKFKFQKESSELEEGLSSSDYKKAQAIVNDPKTKGGNYTQAWKDLEKWKKGSTKDKKVAAMLKTAHESVEESVTVSITEKLTAKSGKAKVDMDWVGDKNLAKQAEKKHKIKIKPTGRTTADISGEKKNILAYLKDPELYGMDDGDIKDLFPELFEGWAMPVEGEEQSPKQKKYQAFFTKALKKFGVKSPQELEGDKRKEFFDYIDANWKGDNESD
jgi:hypothetical protein